MHYIRCYDATADAYFLRPLVGDIPNTVNVLTEAEAKQTGLKIRERHP